MAERRDSVSMGTENTTIALEAAELAIGDSRRTSCPFCGSAERTFSVTRAAHGVLYNCYRSSCGAAGFLPTAGELLQPAPAEPELRPYMGELHGLSDDDLDYFAAKFELPATTARRYIQRGLDGRYALPILNPRGYTRGHMLRVPWGRTAAGAKSILYRSHRGPMQSWYRPIHRPFPRRILLVEDQMSAIRAAEFGGNVTAAVALLGVGGSTKLGNLSGAEGIREIAQEQPDEVIIALDADATDRAFAWARKWGLAFKSTRVAVLERDIKDTLAEDIPDALGL